MDFFLEALSVEELLGKHLRYPEAGLQTTGREEEDIS